MANASDNRHVDLRRLAMAGETRSWFRLSAFSIVAMAGFLAYVGITFSPLVTPLVSLQAWLLGMSLVMVYWAVTVTAFFWRQPDDAELMKVWTRFGRAAQVAFNLGFAICPWILLPHADLGLQSLLLMMYLWYVVTGIMLSSVVMPVPPAEVLLLLVSPIIFLFRHPSTHSVATVIFLAAVALNLLALVFLVKLSVERGIDVHLALNRAEAAARAAEAQAAAERDAKTRFIAAASHDLQQPLQAASLFFEATVDPGSAVARARAIDGVRMAFVSTQALISQILDHLQLEAGAVSPRRDTVELGSLMESVALEHAPAASEAGMRLIVVPSRLRVCADEALLRRALSNLVANAARHAHGRRVLIGSRSRERVATLWVIDDGDGIPEANANHLFEDFSRVSDLPRRASRGFGLGLASASRSLALMDGTLGLERRWANGSAFYLRLPLSNAEPARLVSKEDAIVCAAA